jgi:hypothetical protein
MAISAPSGGTRLLPVRPDNLPELLKQQPRWLGWRAGRFRPDGKFSKSPANPSTGRKINGRDPANWMTFERAMKAYHSGLADGIGFALSGQHPIILDGVDFYVTVADFDHCNAKMKEIQALWLELGQPFIEVSPSNNGLHVWGLTRSPLRGGNAGDGRELYSGGRFMTMTGIGARGTFHECSGLSTLEKRWFPAPTAAVNLPPTRSRTDVAGLPGDLMIQPARDNWFERLSPEAKDACLAKMLQVPAVIALADTCDETPSPNWRTVLAACVRSGAPDAYSLCRAWAQTSERFDPDDFDVRWRSYARG